MTTTFEDTLKDARKILYGHYQRISDEIKKHKNYTGRNDVPYISMVLNGKVENLFVLDCANIIYALVKKENVEKERLSQQKKKKLFA